MSLLIWLTISWWATGDSDKTAYDGELLFGGSWERDEIHDPLHYKGFVKGGFRMCFVDARHNCYEDYTNKDFTNWRWKSRDPDFREFDAQAMMKLFQGRRVAIVGDSLAHQHFQSLACLLSHYLEPLWGGKWAEKDLIVDISLIPSEPWGNESAVPSAAQTASSPFWSQVENAIREGVSTRSKNELFGCKLQETKLAHKGTSWYIETQARCSSMKSIRRLQRILVRHPLLDINVQGIRARLSAARYHTWTINHFGADGGMELNFFSSHYLVRRDNDTRVDDALKRAAQWVGDDGLMLISTGGWWFDCDPGIHCAEPPNGGRALRSGIIAVSEYLKTGFKGHVIWRTPDVNHFYLLSDKTPRFPTRWDNWSGGCAQMDGTLFKHPHDSNERVGLYNATRHALWSQPFACITPLDVWHISGTRPDAHPGSHVYHGSKHGDCLHWCLGRSIPEAWNAVLFNLLRKVGGVNGLPRIQTSPCPPLFNVFKGF